MALPLRVTRPSTGGMKPAMAFRIVDLPQPEGPSSTTRSWLWMSKLTR